MIKTYAYHKPSEKSIDAIALIRDRYSDLHQLIEKLVINSRERACAITNLETSAMWAIKAIVHNDPESIVE